MINKSDLFGAPIYTYTRSQALADGELVDVSEMAKQAGFKIPVAVTDTVWHSFVEWSKEDSVKQTHQDTNGRLWDILFILRIAIAKSKDTDQILYKLLIVPRDGKTIKAKLTHLNCFRNRLSAK